MSTAVMKVQCKDQYRSGKLPTYPSPKPTLAKGVTVVEIVQQSVKTRRIRYYVENESTRCEFTEQQKILSLNLLILFFSLLGYSLLKQS